MTGSILSGVTALAAVVGAVAAGAEIEKGFVSMFNGKDLTGWEGKPGGWTVQDGAITGQSTPEKPCKKHHYLMWRGGTPGDFELRLSYRIVGGNSGIQIRSREIANWDTRGFGRMYVTVARAYDVARNDEWRKALLHYAGVATQTPVRDPRGFTNHGGGMGSRNMHQSKLDKLKKGRWGGPAAVEIPGGDIWIT